MKLSDVISRNANICVLLLLLLVGVSAFAAPATRPSPLFQRSEVSNCDGTRLSPMIIADDVVNDVAKQDTQQERKRCKAVTQKGTQCKRDAKEGKEYCWQHETVPAGDRCKAITKKGTQCSRKAKTADGYCTQHAKMRE
ncbi:MAG: DUF5763 domain-containing protein [Bacteroidia bacterium]|nr:DUF5763 domain-containing protein [Bacteroidia bacterium]